MSWQVYRLKEGEKKFILVGCGYRLSGEVWRGAMKGDVFWGLKALESPVLASRLLRRWRVAAPRRFASEDNTGLSRKYVEFLPLAFGASFALRFAEYVPSELLRDLKVAFGGIGTARKEPDHEESPRAALQHSPEAAGGRGTRRHVQRQDRQPARSRQDPRTQGEVGRRKKRS